MSFLKKMRSLVPLRRLLHIEKPKQQKELPDPWDLMTGKELYQATQYAKGNLDPFDYLPKKRGPGTKDCPNIVYSVFEDRAVACHCHPDANHMVYFVLHEGFPRRCECNYWFVLERVPLPQPYDDYP